MTDAAQRWNAVDYATHARFVAELGTPVLDVLAPRAGERVLDVGCGDGVLTAKIAAAGAAVVGIDSSPDMVDAARAAGLEAYLMDARALAFAEPFDAVFSNAALHWVPEPGQAVAAVRASLRSGGRFVGEFGGHGNVAALRTALAAVLNARGITVASPWYFPTADEFAALLREHGFDVDAIALIARPTPLPTGVRGWLDTFANPFFAGVDAAVRAELIVEIETLLAPMLRDTAGRWTADYVRLRFAARALTEVSR